MLVYGDVVRRVEPTAEWAAIGGLWQDAWRRPSGLQRHSALVQAFIAAGELAQGVADAEAAAAGADEPGPATTVAMDTLRQLAATVLRSWREAFVAERSSVVPWPSLPAEALPPLVACKRGEGYAYYALYPEAYGLAAEPLKGEPDLRVVGLRSIGTGLAAMTAAGAEAGTPLTLRPSGHPFGREIAPGPDAARRLLHGGPAAYAIVDEGPGLSGSSFAGTAEWLVRQGVSPARIHLFPSHPGEPGAKATPERRRWWRGANRRCVTFDALVMRAAQPAHRLTTWVADMVGPLDGDLQDISGGRWRERLGGARDAPVNAWQERLKYLAHARDGAWLAKFSGLDRLGAAAFDRARLLARNGFTPEPAGWAHGFVVERWRGDARLLEREEAATPAFQARLAAYLGLRARAFAAPTAGATLADLAQMLQHNAGEAFGPAASDAAESWRHSAAALQRCVVPVVTDNRLHAHEWVVTSAGRVLKTDALDHAFAHDLVGCQDIAWDVAGATVEFSLDPDSGERLRRSVALAAEREVSADLVRFLRPCYAAFQLGWWSMAADAHGGWPEEQVRLTAQTDRYRRALGAMLLGPDGAA